MIILKYNTLVDYIDKHKEHLSYSKSALYPRLSGWNNEVQDYGRVWRDSEELQQKILDKAIQCGFSHSKPYTYPDERLKDRYCVDITYIREE